VGEGFRVRAFRLLLKLTAMACRKCPTTPAPPFRVYCLPFGGALARLHSIAFGRVCMISNSSPFTYIVTGGAGFIGSHLTTTLVQQGQRVRVVDNLSSGKAANLAHLDPASFSLHHTSILDRDALTELFSGAEVVFHLAALPSVHQSLNAPDQTHAVCATGTLNVLMAARAAGVRRVVYAASSAAYGDDPINGAEPRHEAMPPSPISPYGAAKLSGELYCQAFSAAFGLETVCLRYFNVFGERQDPTSQYAAVIPIFIQRMLGGQAPIIYGDGLQSRDFVYVGDVVRANLLAAAASSAAVGQVMNIATGHPTTLLELVDMINELLGTTIAPHYEAGRSGDIRYSLARIQRAHDLIGYTPQFDLIDGLRRAIDFYRHP
jgi:UDP-glucose 4-epimerase